MALHKERFDSFKWCSILQSPSEIIYLPRRNFWLQNHGPAYYQAAEWVIENGKREDFTISGDSLPSYSYGVTSDQLLLLQDRFTIPILRHVLHGIRNTNENDDYTDTDLDRFYTDRLGNAIQVSGYSEDVLSVLLEDNHDLDITFAIVNRDALECDHPVNLSIFRQDSPSFISMNYFPKSDTHRPKAVVVVESLRALQLAERQDELPHYRDCLGSIAYHELAHIFVEAAMYYLMPQYRLYSLPEEKVRFPLIEFLVSGLCPDYESLMLCSDDTVEKQTSLLGWTSIYDGQFIENHIKLRPYRDRERVARLADVAGFDLKSRERLFEAAKKYNVVFPVHLLSQNDVEITDFDLAFMLVCILLSYQTNNSDEYDTIPERLSFINPDWEEILFG